MLLLQALVVNMTPTLVRVIEGTISDQTKPDIQVKLLQTMPHDMRVHEHSHNYAKNGFTECNTCRCVLSWLLVHVADDGSVIAEDTGVEVEEDTHVKDKVADTPNTSVKIHMEADHEAMGATPLDAHDGNKRVSKALPRWQGTPSVKGKENAAPLDLECGSQSRVQGSAKGV